MRRSLIGLALCVALASLACSGKSKGKDDGKVAEDGAGVPSIKVTVLAAGVEPRRALRYQLGGPDRRVNLALEVAAPVPNEGMKFGMVVDWRAARSADPGRMRRDWSVSSTRTLAAPGSAGAGERQIIDTLASAYRGNAGHAVANSAGHASFTRTSAGAPVRPTVEGMFEMAVVPLPSEPVGVGARWRADRTETVDGETYTLSYTYELVALAADGARVRISGMQVADTGTPTADAGNDGELDAAGVGLRYSGEAEIGFSDCLPRSGRWTWSLVHGGVVSTGEADGGGLKTEETFSTDFVITVDG